MGNPFDDAMHGSGFGTLTARSIDTVQVNVGYRCNQACRHCHLEAGPHRAEMMSGAVLGRVASVIREIGCRAVDITGGAPELHPGLLGFIDEITGPLRTVTVRTNLSVLVETGMEPFPEAFAARGVGLVGSMPCYLEPNVDGQRGDGVYRKCIAALRRLNAVGYGLVPGLPLTLLYNPEGPTLPQDCSVLEADYRKVLRSLHGIEFTTLVCLANMPIGRFHERLKQDRSLDSYLAALRQAFNPRTVECLMCRTQISVGWDGTLYDCDFNQGLRLPVDHGAPDRIESFDAAAIANREIVTGAHCLGCTAGRGSSCGGALV